MSKSKKTGDDIGKTVWDVIYTMRPKNLKFYHYIFIFLSASTLLSIYSGSEDGNLFFYIRVLTTKLYQEQNILVALLLVICLILLVVACYTINQIHYTYKPEIERLKSKNATSNDESQTKSAKTKTQFT